MLIWDCSSISRAWSVLLVSFTSVLLVCMLVMVISSSLAIASDCEEHRKSAQTIQIKCPRTSRPGSLPWSRTRSPDHAWFWRWWPRTVPASLPSLCSDPPADRRPPPRSPGRSYGHASPSGPWGGGEWGYIHTHIRHGWAFEKGQLHHYFLKWVSTKI